MKQKQLTGLRSRFRSGGIDRQVTDKAKILKPMIQYLILYCLSFFLIEHWRRAHYTVIHTAVDDHIPFMEIFIIPYAFWFIYMAAFGLYVFFVDERCYHELCTFLAIGMTVFVIISAVFPNTLMLRPAVMPRSNVFTAMCSLLYRIDTPTNVTPSIHVYNSLGVMIAAWHTNGGRLRSNKYKLAVTAAGMLIILSTMFLKQHSFSDVIMAVGLAIISYIVIYRIGWTVVSDRSGQVHVTVYEH